MTLYLAMLMADTPIMQTLEALPYTTASAAALARAAGLSGHFINPAGIGIRHEPFGPKPNPSNHRMPMANWDPRTAGLFGAAYAVGYFASLGLGECLAEDGVSTSVAGVVYGDSFGERGLCDAETGVLHPAYHVVTGIGRASQDGATLLDVKSSNDSAVRCLGIRREDGMDELWLANITAEEQCVSLDHRMPVDNRTGAPPADAGNQHSQNAI